MVMKHKERLESKNINYYQFILNKDTNIFGKYRKNR